MTKARQTKNKRLWSMVRQLPGGEETLRDIVARLRQEDGTGTELLGTAEYTSTRLLTDGQYSQLLNMVSQHLPWATHRKSELGNTTWLISDAQKKYIHVLAERLGWSAEALSEFVAKQTKGKGLRTHREASAVIEPMERLALEKGCALDETKGRKWINKRGDQ